MCACTTPYHIQILELILVNKLLTFLVDGTVPQNWQIASSGAGTYPTVVNKRTEKMNCIPEYSLGRDF
jgi:hypothetical protein